jgi:hypothetical protein
LFVVSFGYEEKCHRNSGSDEERLSRDFDRIQTPWTTAEASESCAISKDNNKATAQRATVVLANHASLEPRVRPKTKTVHSGSKKVANKNS